MESSEEKKECVKVAVNVRPLITTELLMGCTDCVTVVPGEPQVQIGSHAFTYDHVYGCSGAPSSSIFEECVLPLVDALFHGYNATVLAYGQTGSGKTYTMGTNYSDEGNPGGIIPQVMETIFRRVETMKDSTEFLIRVSFIEIFKEEVFDLLDPQSIRAESAPLAKSATIARTPIQIRETMNGGITLAGVIEAEVRSKDEMASYLARGSLSRATGSTNMNNQSSRSHAIFTICMEQKKMTNQSVNGSVNNEVGDDILLAKLHLVDLAGSERAKRTGADGLRLKEGIHINRGLLALGNVISALGDEKKRKEGGHVPYRDSKLTRLLQDSLGGNSKTVMIACISPADSNAEETINTLKYANRARNIQNKAVVNRDPVAAEMQRMRNQLEQLQAELLFCRGGNASLEELQILRQKNSVLEARNAELHQEVKEHQLTCERLKQSALDAQVEKDNLILKMESARTGKPWDEIDKANKNQGVDLIRGYISKIQELEAELLRAQHLSASSRSSFMDRLSLEDVTPSCDGETEEDEKEREHSSLRNQLDKELQELDRCLEQKEAEMKLFAKSDTSILKQHYEKKLLELEQEKKLLLKEIEDLHSKFSSVSSIPDESAEKLKADYLQKLNMLETQVSELKKKQEAQAQLLRQKQKSDEAAKRLQDEIQRIKSQKVQLQHKIKQESEQFRLWKASREKEVMQLKKEGRRNEYEMHKLLALNQRQKMVLQRKSEEAALATKRLKELLEAKRSREVAGPGNANGAGIQALIQAVDHELEVTLRVHEVRSEYERQMKERAAMAKEVARLKEESEMLKQKTMMECPQTMSPSARSSRISALENMLKASSSTLVAMASQLSEAEERERVFSGRGRWNQIRSLPDAKHILNHLFNIASSSRCEIQDKELSYQEKDSMISELKEKVVRLNCLVRELEIQLGELQKEKLKRLSSQRDSNQHSSLSGNNMTKAPGTSELLNDSFKNLEDMDISDSENSDTNTEKSDESHSDIADEDWVQPEYQSDLGDDSVEPGRRKANRRSKTGQGRRLTIQSRKSLHTESLSEEGKPDENDVPDNCCSCSKYSYCKTKRCECMAAGGVCGASCGCVSSRCTNRGNGTDNEIGEEESNNVATECGESHSSGDQGDNGTSELVSQGTLLLQSALSEKDNQENGNVQPRKALSDIGNTMAKKASKTSKRKKWRKSTIQLVPTAPLPPAIPETHETLRSREDVPLRLPRALESVPSVNNPPLWDRNSARHDESTNNKEVRGVLPRRSPMKPRKASDQKENHMT